MRFFGQAEETDDLLVRGTGYLALTDLPRQPVEPRTTRRVRLEDFAQLLIGRVRHTVDRTGASYLRQVRRLGPAALIARVTPEPIPFKQSRPSEAAGQPGRPPPSPSRALPETRQRLHRGSSGRSFSPRPPHPVFCHS